MSPFGFPPESPGVPIYKFEARPSLKLPPLDYVSKPAKRTGSENVMKESIILGDKTNGQGQRGMRKVA